MSSVSVRGFSTTRRLLVFKMLGDTLQNTNPRKFEKKEIIKPIGQQRKPLPTDGIDTRTLIQKKNDWLDNDNRLKRKANLEKQFATSGMYDMFIFRKTGGKVFISPKSYFKRDKSLYFPNFIADENISNDKKKNISTYNLFTNFGKTDKFSIVNIFSSDIGSTFTKKYYEINEYNDKNYNEESKGNYLNDNKSYEKLTQLYPNLQVINLSFFDNFFKKWIFKKFGVKAITKNSINNPDYLQKYLILNNDLLDIPTKETIHYLNGVTGYVYIIDNEGKIRWLSCGDPEDSDLKTMWKTVSGLQLELDKKDQ